MTTAGGSINAADTSWMMVATALVLLMTPALAFFYGGLVRSKNALNTMMMSLASLGAVGIAWVVAGYSLAFAPGTVACTAFAWLAVWAATVDGAPRRPAASRARVTNPRQAFNP